MRIKIVKIKGRGRDRWNVTLRWRVVGGNEKVKGKLWLEVVERNRKYVDEMAVDMN